MNTYLIVKALHIVSASVLVGTGFGSAFNLFWINRSGSVPAQAMVARWVVKADLWLTTPAGIFQPLSGLWLMHLAGWRWDSTWLLATFALYGFAGLCWLPVLWLQVRMRDLATDASAHNTPLPSNYRLYQRYWEWLGYPAFIAMIVVYFLMVTKP